MKRKLFLGIVLFFLTIGLILILPRLAISQEMQVAMCRGDMMGGGQYFSFREIINSPIPQFPNSPIPQFPNSPIPHFSSSQIKSLNEKYWGGGMMNGGMMGGNREDMQIVHQLFANHNQIRRTVEEIPGGVRTLTESDNPQIAALIQAHVKSMHQRVDEGRWFTMMSRTLPIMFRNADRYQRQHKNTSKGIAVTKTSDDPDLVAVLREHSREVSSFVEGGMPCMGGGRMRGW